MTAGQCWYLSGSFVPMSRGDSPALRSNSATGEAMCVGAQVCGSETTILDNTIGRCLVSVDCGPCPVPRVCVARIMAPLE